MNTKEIKKRCSKCKEYKPLDEFHKNNATKDLLNCYCIPCANEKNRVKRKKASKELSDSYVAQALKVRTGISAKKLRQQYPEHIKTYKEYLQLNRSQEKRNFKYIFETNEIIKWTKKRKKKCTKCNEKKPLNEFNNDQRAKDGKTSWCKKCGYKISRRWHILNKKRKEVPKELIYHNSNYFNKNDTYVIWNHILEVLFESKVEFSKGNWWTVKYPYFKCTSVKCISIIEIKKICPNCKKEKSINEFRTRKYKKTIRTLKSANIVKGYQYICSICEKEYMNAKQKIYYRKPGNAKVANEQRKRRLAIYPFPDAYIAGNLRISVNELRTEMPGYIEAKREHLLLKREILNIHKNKK